MNNSVVKSIERMVGLPIEKIRNMTLDEELLYIQNKNKRKVKFTTRRNRGVCGRGNPLLSKRKFRTMSYVDNKINEITKIYK